MNDNHRDEHEHNDVDHMGAHAGTFDDDVGGEAFFEQHANGDGDKGV
jgi:hypothetical protein